VSLLLIGFPKKSATARVRIFLKVLFSLALLLVCLANASARAPQDPQESIKKVWVNTKSGVYHCPGTQSYGKTKAGIFMEQPEAQQKGYRPAHGKTCDSAIIPSPSESEAIQDSSGRQCGFERWPVKVLTDKDRELVSSRPVEATVTALNDLEPHQTYPYDHRWNEELRVYRVRARLIDLLPESDSDLHLIIADLNQPDITMIAEIPAPYCALGSGHEDDYKAARLDALQISLGSLVEIEGVGFFDTMHAQRGLAKNGFEIHPVLKIRVVK
jgi:hypothetical protein